MARLWSVDTCAREPVSAGAPVWLADAQRDLARRLLDPDPGYPCHFGVAGQVTGHTWITAVQPDDPQWSIDALAGTLRAYRRIAWQGAKRQSLVVFAGPPRARADLAEDTARFWALLGELTARDQAGWPADRPRDVRDPAWQWCFAGEAWFVFGASPAYLRRRSRNLGPCLALVFQTRRVFDGLAGSTVAGRAAKRRVRAALEGYDQAPIHPHLGDPMHSSTFKWRQYMLPDDESVTDELACPFDDAAGAARLAA